MNYLEIEKEMAKTYNGIAKKYEKEAKEDFEDKTKIDSFLKYINKGYKILDIACGTGELLEYYTQKGFKTTGIDIAEEMVKMSKDKVPNANIFNMSLYDLDKLEEKFDAISATYILVHIPKEKINEVVCKIRERLNDKGIVLIMFTTDLKEGIQPEPLDNNYRFYAINYQEKEVASILEQNKFEILESREIKGQNDYGRALVIARKK